MVLENHSDGHNPESDESSFGYETCIHNYWPGNCGCFTKVNQLRIVSFQVLMVKLSVYTNTAIQKETELPNWNPADRKRISLNER